MNQGEETTSATPTYDPNYNPTEYPDADLELVAKDEVRFSVHKTVLRLSSTFFRDMFALPSGGDDANAGIQTVMMSESSDVLHLLLDLVYPGKILPNVSSLTLFYDVALTAEKLDMQSTLQTLAKYLPLLKMWNLRMYAPVPLYALGVRIGWVDIAREAALETLETDLGDAMSASALSDNIRFVNVGTLLSLQDWHANRRKIILQAVDDLKANNTTSLFGSPNPSYYSNLDWHYLHCNADGCSTSSSAIAVTQLAPVTSVSAFSRSTSTFQSHKPSVFGQSPRTGQATAQTTASTSSQTTATLGSWNRALLRFRHRAQHALYERPDCNTLLHDEFWDDALWELGGEMKCVKCGREMINKAKFREGLAALVEQLPRFPGDTRQPTRHSGSLPDSALAAFAAHQISPFASVL